MNLFHSMPQGLLVLFVIPLIVAVILVLAAGRRDDDPAGTRTQMRYVGAIGIVTLFVALLSFFGVVRALTSLVVDGSSTNDVYRRSLNQGLLMLAALAVFVFHYRRATALAPAKGFARGGTGSAARAGLYGVCFVAAVIALVAAAKGLYGIFQLIAPGVFGVNGVPRFVDLDSDTVRQTGIANFLSFGSLSAASVLIFLRAWNWLPEHRS